jgi:hypothetical protein
MPLDFLGLIHLTPISQPDNLLYATSECLHIILRPAKKYLFMAHSKIYEGVCQCVGILRPSHLGTHGLQIL